MENLNAIKEFNVGDYVYNIATKEVYEITKYVPEIEYNIHHIYELRNLENDKLSEFSKGYMILRMESFNTLDTKIRKYNELINSCIDSVSDLKWMKHEFKNKLSQYDITEGNTKK